jgi:membrane-associated protease RseP (regulator of RpoE activity)
MGPFIMIVGIILMIVIHEGGHFVAAKYFGMKATEAFFGFGPRLWSTRRGETEYGVKAIPLGGYVRIIGMNPFEEVAPEEEGRTYRAALFWKKSVVVLAGIATHFVVAFVILFLVGLIYGTVARDADDLVLLTTTVGAVSEMVLDDSEASPAAIAGVDVDDVIVATDGVPVVTWEDFANFTKERPGESVVISLEREGERLDLTTTLATVERAERDGQRQVILDADDEPVLETVGFFGVSPLAEREDHGPIGMIGVAVGQMGEAIIQSVNGLWQMVVGFPKLLLATFGGDDEILETVRPVSPIGLVKLAGPLESTLVLLALVNIFVGVLNFVPLYPLDGGHFAVALYEKVTGRVPAVERMMPVAAAVFIFLVSLGLMGLYFDTFGQVG